MTIPKISSFFIEFSEAFKVSLEDFSSFLHPNRGEHIDYWYSKQKNMLKF